MVLPKSGIGQAIGYALGEWESLARYVEIAEAEIDNNGAERALRGVVVGRKNWLFIGHPKAGPRAAVILSLVETCRRLGVDPYQYLREILAELPRNPRRAAELAPRAWLQAKRARQAQASPPAPQSGL